MVPSEKPEIITNDERVRIDVRNNKVHADALRMCTGNLGVDYARGGKRTGAKVMAMQDDLPEASASSGSQGGESRQDRCCPLPDLRI